VCLMHPLTQQCFGRAQMHEASMETSPFSPHSAAFAAVPRRTRRPWRLPRSPLTQQRLRPCPDARGVHGDYPVLPSLSSVCGRAQTHEASMETSPFSPHSAAFAAVPRRTRRPWRLPRSPYYIQVQQRFVTTLCYDALLMYSQSTEQRECHAPRPIFVVFSHIPT
jgi:hypothetical protein